ncbi:DUF6702 family protein [Puia dinghuensis]|uniref:Uncharacterized protein n=1 Tax=Puia dinghuensis TaxID=1792502 RepID=A0A8J2XRX6_9BACT|nr:DUF6702 family protein [Puia dinghuensis]GGA90934.1 hypothetical protein GCM10011511_12790 [Puia dinghuensis]
MAASLFKWFGVVIFSLVFVGKAPAGTHPLYISVTELNHNPKDKILEVSCKMFTNDLETALEKMSGSHVDLSAAKDKAASDKLISVYVEKHLRLKLDGKPVQLQFVGSEKENDGTWSYFQVNGVAAVKRIDAVNELLYDSFNQQINIMHVTVGGQRKSTRLDCPDANASFEF